MKVDDDGNEEKLVFDGVGGPYKERERLRHGLEGVMLKMRRFGTFCTREEENGWPMLPYHFNYFLP